MFVFRSAYASALFVVLCACGGQTPPTDTTGADGATDSATSAVDAPLDSATSSGSDGATDSVAADALPPVRRLPCLGSGLATDLPPNARGAIEAELVSIVPPGTRGCLNDADHLHLQIEVGTKRYDVAVTINDNTGAGPMSYFEKDIAPSPLPDGWSNVGFDFVKDLGAHSTAFTSADSATMLSKLESELATVSKLTIHGHAYTDGTGLHNVHYNHGRTDGVLLLHGKGAGGTDHAFAIRFINDVF